MLTDNDPFAQFGDLGMAQVVSTDDNVTKQMKREIAGGIFGGGTGSNPNRTIPPQTEVPGAPPMKTMPRSVVYVPPAGCLVDDNAVIKIPLKNIPVADFDWNDQNNLGVALRYATQAQKMTIAQYQAAWKTRFPWAPDARLFLSLQDFHDVTMPNLVLIEVLRPETQYDPILYMPPPIEKGDPREKPFAAALRIFFPDFVFEQRGKNPGFYHGYGQGSYTSYGPFPLGVLYVSDRMIDFAVKYLKKGGFGNPAVAQSATEAGSLMRQGAGLATAAGGPYGAVAGAVLAVSSFIVDLFGGNQDPTPPKWLTDLMQIKTLRETPGRPSFASADLGRGGAITCNRAVINPTIDGKYALLDGYEELLRRMGGAAASGGWLKWLMLAGTGAAMALGGG